MAVPAWREMPKTEEDPSQPGYREGALIRSRHRVLMALRWRNLEARAEDKALKRLPEDWHDWMGCPAAEQGYGSPPCTCDIKLSKHPRDEVQRERDLRRRLSNELKFSFRERKLAMMEGRIIAVDPPKPLIKVLWVKTIDTATCAPTISPRKGTSYGVVKGMGDDKARVGPIAGYPASNSSPVGQASVSTRCLKKRLGKGVRLHLPAWITAGRRALSLLLGSGRTTG